MTPDIQTVIPSQKMGGDITYMDMVDETEALGESQIQKMFSGLTVLVTGGTGFLGKLMVEKLLSTCPDIKRIYLLARPKKNKLPIQRLKEQFDDVLYDKLRKVQPNFIDKVSIIEGDVGQLRCGVSDEDAKKLADEVEVIFHGAATVRFDEALKTAVNINVRGTKEMLLLARTCSKLKAFVHISTAYSNCPLNEIDEKFYDYAIHGDKLIALVDSFDEKTLNSITQGLLGDFPNTYAYTKAAAEKIVLKYSKGLPVAMIRPSIIIATARDPVAGWIDNVYGPTGVVVGAGVGLLHALHCNPKAIADLVPGDMVVNACIACAWKLAQDTPTNYEDSPPSDLPPVYNFVSSSQRPLTWETFMAYNEEYGLETPPNQAIYYYVFKLISSRFWYLFVTFFMHWMPAYLVDVVLVIVGKKPMLKKAYTKIEKFSEVISYFSTREWKFGNNNTQKLYNDLCDADKNIYDFDLEALNWSDYFVTYVKGVRMYLMKDSLDTVPQAKKRFIRLRILHYTICTIMAAILIKLVSIALRFFGLSLW